MIADVIRRWVAGAVVSPRNSQRRSTKSKAPTRPKRACRVRPLFTEQNSQPSRRCEEGRHRAPTAVTSAIESRLTVEAVEVVFRRGDAPPSVESQAPPGNALSWSDRQSLGFSTASMRSRRPGLANRCRDSRPRRKPDAVAVHCRCRGHLTPFPVPAPDPDAESHPEIQERSSGGSWRDCR